MIGFPGLGLEFKPNQILLDFGWIKVHWYAVIITVGFVAAVIYCMYLSKRFGVLQDEIIDMLFLALPMGIIGARAVYVLLDWDAFAGNPVAIFQTWTGGMAIYGGILFSAAAAAAFCHFRRINIGAMLDLAAFGFLIGQAVGRWGNFINGEVYGNATDLPWRMSINGAEVHPLFLYESLWNVAGFILLRLLLSKRKYNGQFFALYVAWYGLGRGLLEGMRNPQFNLTIGSDTLAMQVFAFVTCLVALTILILLTLFVKKEKEDLLAWTAARDAYLEEKKAKKAAAKGDNALSEEESPEDSDQEDEIDPTDEAEPQEDDPEQDDFFEDDAEQGQDADAFFEDDSDTENKPWR